MYVNVRMRKAIKWYGWICDVLALGDKKIFTH